jgi:hypothetical protein
MCVVPGRVIAADCKTSMLLFAWTNSNSKWSFVSISTHRRHGTFSLIARYVSNGIGSSPGSYDSEARHCQHNLWFVRIFKIDVRNSPHCSHRWIDSDTIPPAFLFWKFRFSGYAQFDFVRRMLDYFDLAVGSKNRDQFFKANQVFVFDVIFAHSFDDKR